MRPHPCFFGYSVHERAQMDQMEDMIQQRKQTIDNVVNLLTDINAIAKDINVELKNQGNNLEVITRDMQET